MSAKSLFSFVLTLRCRLPRIEQPQPPTSAEHSPARPYSDWSITAPCIRSLLLSIAFFYPSLLPPHNRSPPTQTPAIGRAGAMAARASGVSRLQLSPQFRRAAVSNVARGLR